MPSSPEPVNSRVPSPTRAALPVLKTVFLTGFMGCGKTSVGMALAKHLGWHFEDLDSRIEARQQRAIADIFQRDGERAFRQVERQALADLKAALSAAPSVVALGGGTIVQPGNIDLLQAADTAIVFLDAPVEELWARCQEQATARPLRQDPEHFRNLYQARREFYTRAEVHIQTSGKSVDAIAQEIAHRLRCNYELKEKSR